MYNNIYKTCVFLLRGIHTNSFQGCAYNVALKIKPSPSINLCSVQSNVYTKRCMSNEDSTTLNESQKIKIKMENEMLEKYNNILQNPKESKQLKILELEVDLWRQAGSKVPEVLSPKHWVYLMKTESKQQRRQYLEYLWVIEIKQQKKKAEKAQKSEQRAKRMEEEESQDNTSGLEYGLGKVSLFQRIYDSTMNTMQNYKLILAMMLDESKVVIDCGFEKYMKEREIHNCAKQLVMAFSENRIHDDPVNLYLCNADPNGTLIKKCLMYIPTMYNTDFPLNITSTSYLDIFDKEKLVYLTPHCRNYLEEYDPDAIYIIGAMVDRFDPKPYTLAKAKEEGIRMARFPLEKYLNWGTGASKTLTINQSLRILLDLRRTKNWNKSFDIIPTRKLKQTSIKNLIKSVSGHRNETTLHKQDDKHESNTFQIVGNYLRRYKNEK